MFNIRLLILLYFIRISVLLHKNLSRSNTGFLQPNHLHDTNFLHALSIFIAQEEGVRWICFITKSTYIKFL